MTTNTDDGVHQEQIVQFSNSNAGDAVEAPPLIDATFDDGLTRDNSLAEFLKRPVKIFETTWNEGTQLAHTLSPWELFYNNSTIKEKLETYAFLRSKLRILVQVNASPFYSGKAYVAYRPLPNWGVSPHVVIGGNQQLVTYSQYPNFLINPADSEGGSMELPYFYYKNWLNVGTLQEFTDMGLLYLQSAGVLKNANAVVGAGVKITIWAMATDVVLSGSTAALALQSLDFPDEELECLVSDEVLDIVEKEAIDCNTCWAATWKKLKEILIEFTRDELVREVIGRNRFRKQSENTIRPKTKMRNRKGKMKPKMRTIPEEQPETGVVALFNQVNKGFKDEYGKGVVSTTASAIARGARVASTIPIIGEFATATSMLADSVADVADYFGYSNVPNVENVSPFKDTPFHAMASPNISTPVEKLSMDSKNELSIDSRTVGLDGTDELSIESIVTRPSFLNLTNWSSSDASGTVLFSANVCPSHLRGLAVTKAQAKWLTPMTHVSQLFDQWRGDIIFTFDAYKTRYHAGRLLLVWDPVNTTATNDPTKIHTAVWDIAADDTFQFRVKYNQDTPWLDTFRVDSSNDGSHSTSAAVNIRPGIDNGTVTLYVLNPLTGPTGTQDFDIAVSVAGGENLEFNRPTQVDPSLTTFVPQSENWRMQSENSVQERNIAEVDSNVSALALVTHGEDHVSLRPLLKRTCQYVSYEFPSDTTSAIRRSNFNWPRFPVSPGYDPAGFHVTDVADGSNPYNFVANTPYTWISPAFIGQRGSVNYRVNVQSPDHIDHVALHRNDGVLTGAGHLLTQSIATGLSSSQFARGLLNSAPQNGMLGMSLVNQKTQTGSSAQIPMYSKYRMLSTRSGATGKGFDGSTNDSLVIDVMVQPVASGNNSNTTMLHSYYCMGTDFTLFYYLAAPCVYHLTTIPLAG